MFPSTDSEILLDRLRILGATAPMTIFLKQEIDRIQVVITLVDVILKDLLLAIEGVIIMSEVIFFINFILNIINSSHANNV